jgi:hypothetical protein
MEVNPGLQKLIVNKKVIIRNNVGKNFEEIQKVVQESQNGISDYPYY